MKIDTLARNLIRLSGHTPGEDIKIEYTGLRLGEKLYEEKLMAEEGLKKTENDLIYIGCPIPFDIETFLGQLEELMEVAHKNKDDIKKSCKRLLLHIIQRIPHFWRQSHINEVYRMNKRKKFLTTTAAVLLAY